MKYNDLVPLSNEDVIREAIREGFKVNIGGMIFRIMEFVEADTEEDASLQIDLCSAFREQKAREEGIPYY